MSAGEWVGILSGVGGLVIALVSAYASARNAASSAKKSDIEALRAIIDELQQENERLSVRIKDLETENDELKARLRATEDTQPMPRAIVPARKPSAGLALND